MLNIDLNNQLGKAVESPNLDKLFFVKNRGLNKLTSIKGYELANTLLDTLIFDVLDRITFASADQVIQKLSNKLTDKHA